MSKTPTRVTAPDAVRAMSIKKAVELAGIGRTSLYGKIKSGELRARKVGSRTVILDSDLAAFLNSLPVVNEFERVAA